MASRGELGFLMTKQLFLYHRLSSFSYKVTVWALLITNVFPPVVLRHLLSNTSPTKEKKKCAARGILEVDAAGVTAGAGAATGAMSSVRAMEQGAVTKAKQVQQKVKTMV